VWSLDLLLLSFHSSSLCSIPPLSAFTPRKKKVIYEKAKKKEKSNAINKDTIHDQNIIYERRKSNKQWPS
jgi:hypothetical protein